MSNFKIGRIVLGSVRTNCYFIYHEETKETVVIDPADEGEKIFRALSDQGLKITAILLTHGHFDHIMGARELRMISSSKIYAPERERNLLSDAELNYSSQMGYPYTVRPNVWLKDHEKFTLAGFEFEVIETPGHTEGSVCYYIASEKVLISGDTLFEESVGRTDFPTGSQSALVRSLREKVFPLGEDITVYPGHGNSTTIGHEKQYNPYA